MILRRVADVLGSDRARTHPHHDSPGLRGRTYPVPFDRVWNAALGIARERRGWSVVRTDDMDGVIEIEAKKPLVGIVDDVQIRIKLDRNAQTRVDVSSASRVGPTDLGTNAWRIRRFFKHLDRRLESVPAGDPAG